MILTLDEYKKYLPLQSIQEANVKITEAHETRALYKWLTKYLGSTLVDSLTEETPDAELLAKVKPVLANFTYFEALPFLNLVLTGSGFGIISNQNMAPASTDRIKALAVGLLEAAHNYLDRLIIFLEQNVEAYSDWNQCSLNPGSLLTTADNFNERLKMNQSRVTFITLIPHIKNAEILKIGNNISDEFLQELILGSDANVKPLVETAAAYYAWAGLVNYKPARTEKHADSEFIFSQKQMLYAQYNATGANKMGDDYLMQAIAYLNKNLESYLTYNDYAYEAPYENTAENGFYVT